MTKKPVVMGILIALMATALVFGQVGDLETGVYECINDNVTFEVHVINSTRTIFLVENGQPVFAYSYGINGNDMRMWERGNPDRWLQCQKISDNSFSFYAGERLLIFRKTRSLPSRL
jgi:hypothetical protein